MSPLLPPLGAAVPVDTFFVAPVPNAPLLQYAKLDVEELYRPFQYANVFNVGIYKPLPVDELQLRCVTVVILEIERVVNAPVVVEPETITLVAVNEVAPVPPAATGNVPDVITPEVPVYNALLEAVPTYPLLVITPCE